MKSKKIEELICLSQYYTAKNDYQSAIICLNKALEGIETKDNIDNYYVDNVLWPLGNLYHAMEQYDKALEIENVEYNAIISLDNPDENYANISTDSARRLVRFCMSHGLTYNHLNEPIEAMNFLSLGYFIAYRFFGEFDIETLKLAYNIASIEYLHGNEAEGIRQMKYCYYDMCEHLGNDNNYAIKVEKALKSILEDDPRQLFQKYLDYRKNSKVVIDAFMSNSDAIISTLCSKDSNESS